MPSSDHSPPRSSPQTSTDDGSGESLTCSICQGDFDPELEGGGSGFLGILPVALCPTCFAGMMDLLEQARPRYCPECGGDTLPCESPTSG